VTNDEAKAVLSDARESFWCPEALDIALWLLEREGEVAKVREAGEAHSRSIDVWVQGLIDWEREHPKPGRNVIDSGTWLAPG